MNRHKQWQTENVFALLLLKLYCAETWNGNALAYTAAAGHDIFPKLWYSTLQTVIMSWGLSHRETLLMAYFQVNFFIILWSYTNYNILDLRIHKCCPEDGFLLLCFLLSKYIIAGSHLLKDKVNEKVQHKLLVVKHPTSYLIWPYWTCHLLLK